MDIFENLFNEFRSLILYKDLISIDIKNENAEINIPEIVFNIVDIDEVKSYFKKNEQRIDCKIHFSIKKVDNEKAGQILKSSWDSIQSEADKVVYTGKVSEVEDDETDESNSIRRIDELDSNVINVCIEGIITFIKEHPYEFWHIFEFELNDMSGRIICKKFCRAGDPKIEKLQQLLIENRYVFVKGRHQAEKMSQSYFVNVSSVHELKLGGRTDKAKQKRIELNIDTNNINTDVLMKTLSKWKHEAFGITSFGSIGSFIEIHDLIKKNKYDIKPVYGVSEKILFDDSTAIFNPDKTIIDSYLCIGEITDGNILITDILYNEAADKVCLKKNDYIGIREFCRQKPLIMFVNNENDEDISGISKSGLTIVNIKKVFEAVENKNYTLNSLYLKLNAGRDKMSEAVINAVSILKKQFTSYEDICIYIADKNTLNDGFNTYNVNILVKSKIGLNNLYKILTKKNCKWNIIPKSYLEAHKQGLFFGSGDEHGELYEMLFADYDDTSILSEVKFYDYFNILSNKAVDILKERKIIKNINELHNFNKYILKIGRELNKFVIATCCTKEVTKRDLLTTNEMLSEFSYFDKDDLRKVVLDDPRKIVNEIDDMEPVANTGKVGNMMDKTRLLKFDNKSENFSREYDHLVNSATTYLPLYINDILNVFDKEHLWYDIEKCDVPYIMNLINNSVFKRLSNKEKGIFKIHIPVDKSDDVCKIIKNMDIDLKPFFVDQGDQISVFIIPDKYNIYDFTPLKLQEDKITTVYSTEKLEEYFVTFILAKDEDVSMISNLYRSVNKLPGDEELEKIIKTDVMSCTNDNKVIDVFSRMKPISENEYLRCIGLVYGEGTWYDNAERLIHERLADIDEVICFDYEYSANENDSDMIKESKRKIKKCISYDEAEIRARNMLIIKWFMDNYRDEFILEYINRYKDLDKFKDEYTLIKANINNSESERYIRDTGTKNILEPLSVIFYLNKDIREKIFKNKPYISISDFKIKTGIDDETIKKLRSDGYMATIANTSQIDFTL
jgi:DNA polymerase III alpha subunit (gram-positive type)